MEGQRRSAAGAEARFLSCNLQRSSGARNYSLQRAEAFISSKYSPAHRSLKLLRSDDGTMTSGQRRLLVTHVPALGNLAAGSLLFGQFLAARPYSLALALIGCATWIVLFGLAFFFAAGE